MRKKEEEARKKEEEKSAKAAKEPAKVPKETKQVPQLYILFPVIHPLSGGRLTTYFLRMCRMYTYVDMYVCFHVCTTLF